MVALEVSYVRLGPYSPSAADVCALVSDSSLCKVAFGGMQPVRPRLGQQPCAGGDHSPQALTVLVVLVNVGRGPWVCETQRKREAQPGSTRLF